MAVLTRSKEIQKAIKAGKAYKKNALIATDVTYAPSVDVLVVKLSDGRRLALPREQLQGLQKATARQISNVEIAGAGTGLHWPGLDVDLSVEGLVNGLYGTKQWMSDLGRIGGSVRSKAKSQAARRNGIKGGRPKLAKRQ